MTGTLQYRLHGSQNFPTWKEKITRILDVSDAKKHIESTKVAPIDPVDLAAWKKIDSRSKLIIMDGVKDHIVPHFSGKKTTLEISKDLESMYQSKNENRRMVLQDRMHNTNITKGGVVPYLTRPTQIRDELGAVGSKIDDDELVRIALIRRDYGMNLCRRRPTWVKDQAHPALPHRLWMRRLFPLQGRPRGRQRGRRMSIRTLTTC